MRRHTFSFLAKNQRDKCKYLILEGAGSKMQKLLWGSPRRLKAPVRLSQGPRRALRQTEAHGAPKASLRPLPEGEGCREEKATSPTIPGPVLETRVWRKGENRGV